MDQNLSTNDLPALPPKASIRTLISLICGILSMMCCGFFAGIPAIVLGRAEIKAINEGKIHESNLVIAKTGIVLGAIGTVLSILLVLFLALLAGIIARGSSTDW